MMDLREVLRQAGVITSTVAVLATAPLVTLVASWLPALLAALQDPAVALREE